MSVFAADPAATVASLGESALLRALRGWLGDAAPPPPAGPGDDCALVPAGGAAHLLATTDGVVFGRHFDDDAPPAAVGAKLLKRNVSDIAAMGGAPQTALVNLLLGRDVSLAWLEEFHRGLAHCAREHRVSVAGGDLAQGPDRFFAAHLTLLGAPGPRALLRTGAGIGDALYVTGALGGSILGRHLDFAPRLAEGRWLARQPAVRAMMDVSDGLAKDLPALLPPGADAALDVLRVPASEAARALFARDGRPELEHALCDGEDYELLFALGRDTDGGAFEAQWRAAFPVPLTRIGQIVPARPPAPGGQLRDAATGAPILLQGARGYEHLR